MTDTLRRTQLHRRFAVYHAVLKRWQSEGRIIDGPDGGLSWTYQEAQRFAEELAGAMQEYNRVLWQDLPYCRQCKDHCCGPVDWSNPDTDALMLGLLGVTPPVLYPREDESQEVCPYLTVEGCAYPTQWRPLTCSTYFCYKTDGSGGADLDMAAYEEVKERLTDTLYLSLPDELGMWMDEFAWSCGAPEDLSELMNEGILELLWPPLILAYREEFPSLDPEWAARKALEEKEDHV